MKPGRAVIQPWLLRVVLLAAGAVPAWASDNADVAIMPFDRRAVDEALSDTLLDAFQVAFSRGSGLMVVAPGDLSTLLGFEKQKELAGCDSGGCLAEIGGALGVRFIVSGRFAKVGHGFLVVVRLMDVQKGSQLALDQETLPTEDEQKLLEGVQRLADRFGKEVANKVGALVPRRPARAASNPAAPAAQEGAPKAQGVEDEEDAPRKKHHKKPRHKTAQRAHSGGGPKWWVVSAVANGVLTLATAVLFLGSMGLGVMGVAVAQFNGNAALVPCLGSGACTCLCGLSCVACLGGLPTTLLLYLQRPRDTVEVDE